jgi:hypothetical protein
MNKLIGLLLLSLLLTTGLASADPQLPAPRGRVILSVSGNIGAANAGDSAEFDRDMLRRLKITRLRTKTPWSGATHEFEGVLVRDLMAALGARGEVAFARALNDYEVAIPTSDFDRYPVLLAFAADGEPLRVKDKGPIWIVYPQDQFRELRSAEAQRKWVAQVTALRFS